jgi:serine/threonine protein kinase
LNDLLRGLLQKDPKDRLRWEELREHDFWKEKIEPPVDEIKYPPPFSLAPTEDEEEEEKQTNERKDVLRLSRIVKSNLEKEQGSSYENGNEDGIRKIGKNTDMEYNFEEDNNDEKGESTTDIDETDSVINISQNTPSTGNVIAERKYEQPNTSRIKAPAQSEGSPRSVPSLALGSAVSLPTPGTAREYKKAVPEDIHKVCCIHNF